MKKRILSFLLTAIMILTMMPVKAEAGGAPTNWGKLNSALQGGTQSTVTNVFEVDDSESVVRKIKLLSDITAGSGNTTLIVGIDKQIILDLNGFVINGKIDDSTSVGSVIEIRSGATLTLKDNSTGKTGKITGGNSTAGGGGVYVEGTLNMYGGTISGNKTSNANGGGVYVNGGIFTMNGGAVTQNNTVGTSQYGGGVYVDNGKFTMTGDSVVSNNSAYNGGGVYIIQQSEFTMSGNSQISNNNASNAYGAVYIADSELSISENSKIEENSAKNCGGVSMINSTVTMTGGSICNNTATNYGGVVMSQSTINMTGGRISGNTATTNYGGVYFAGTLTLGGTAVITGNTAKGASSNVYLAKNMTFKINTPSSGMSIGVTMQTPGVFTTNTADGYLSYFSSDDSTYKVVYDTEKKLKLAKIPKYTTYENWQIKHEGSSGQWTENLQKVEDGLYKIEINWKGSGFNVRSGENPIKKDWYDVNDPYVTIAEGAIAPITTDLFLRVIDDETLKIGVGVAPDTAPVHDPVLVNGQAATETDAGYKSYYECTHCTKYYEDATGLIEITDLDVWKSKNGNGYIPSGNEINAAKTAAKAALDSENAKDPLSDETTLISGKNAIDSAETLADIETAKNNAITAINETQATELASAKTAAKAALDEEDAIAPLTDKAPVTIGKNNIDAATTKATVESAKNAALEAIRNAQNGNALAAAQTAAQAALDAENAKDPLTDASSVTTGKENISKATTLDEVAGAKNAAITAIQTAQAAELASAKKDAKAALDAEDAKDPLTDKAPVTTGKANIDAAATKATVESAKNAALEAIRNAQNDNALAVAQAAAQVALDAENAKDPLTDASSVTTGKENISKATTLDEVAGAKNAAITAIQTAQATELASAKTAAKAALDAEDALAPLEDKTPVETGKSNIDAAATKAAVESAKNTAIDAIQEAQAKNPEPAPKPVEVYYAPLVADLKANEDGVIEWEAGDSLPLEAVKLLVDKPELSLEFTFTYEGEEHTIFIPAGAFEKYYDVTIPWYGPAWLIQYFEKSEKEVIEYTIVSGDTLNALAEKYKCAVEEILALNPYISDKHWIYPNKKLLIPVQK